MRIAIGSQWRSKDGYGSPVHTVLEVHSDFVHLNGDDGLWYCTERHLRHYYKCVVPVVF